MCHRLTIEYLIQLTEHITINNYVFCDVQKWNFPLYEGHLESNERFAIQRYLLIIGKKQNMQVLSHTFTYFST